MQQPMQPPIQQPMQPPMQQQFMDQNINMQENGHNNIFKPPQMAPTLAELQRDGLYEKSKIK